MDKVRLYQILSVLLIPYRDKEFLNPEKDIIANMRYSFHKLKKREDLSAVERDLLTNNYQKSEKELELFLQRHTEWFIRDLDDFRLLLNLFYPEKCVSELFENDTVGLYKIDRVYLSNIYEVAKSLLTFRDGKTAIRTWINEFDESDIFRYPNVFDKVEIWNLLGRMLTTDIIIAAFFVETGLEDVFYLEGQTGGILLADKTLEKILQKGLAETHMHFKAGAEYSFLWQEVMDLRTWEKALLNEYDYDNTCQMKKSTFLLPVYRLVWAEYLENESEKSFFDYVNDEYSDFSEELMEMFWCLLNGRTLKYREKWVKLYNEIAWKWKICYEQFDTEFLFTTVYEKYRKYHTCSEMIFLFKSLLYFKRHLGLEGELRLFFQYIRYKNLYFGECVQSNQIQGLSNFRIFYEKASEKFHNEMERRKHFDAIFKSIAHNVYLRKLEVRISPEVKIYSDARYYDYDDVRKEIRKGYLLRVREVLNVYRQHLIDTAGIDTWETSEERDYILDVLYKEKKAALPVLGIVFHFIKSDFVDNRIGDTCWVQRKEEINSYSKHIRVWREALVKCARILEELRSEIPLFGEYVVGIDTASEENKTEPWIFAPLYAGIRNRKITRPALKDSRGNILRINNLGFTYHVGEEYRHLLSGLRHIDEVIEHFHYKAGDRLGHAIALGIDVKLWINANEVVVIPVIEHMENLIWIWGNMVYRNWGLEISIPALEGRIMDLAKKIYGEINGLTVHMLYEAYTDKFRLDYEPRFERVRKYICEDDDIDNYGKHGWNHFCKFYNVKQPLGVTWTADKVFCTYFCPLFYQNFMQPILLHVNSKEYRFLHKVQKYLLQKVEEVGIYVETNPTSNLAIGDSRTLYSPHILNLNSKDLINGKKVKHEVLVTINSDDPVVFNTSSENELSYVYHALTYRGYKKESVLRWIDKVRRMGMDSSFIKNEKKPSQQLNEITELIERIDEIVNLDK